MAGTTSQVAVSATPAQVVTGLTESGGARTRVQITNAGATACFLAFGATTPSNMTTTGFGLGVGATLALEMDPLDILWAATASATTMHVLTVS